MSTIYFVTHPAVIIDPRVPIPDWDLSADGKEAIQRLLKEPWLETVDVIFTSTEQKARTGALMIANQLKLPVNYLGELGEIDRSATGYLKPSEFNEVVDQFFAVPTMSIRGWETAQKTQERIVDALAKVCELTPGEPTILIMAHGGVGALLLSHLKHILISRREEPPALGCYFSFERETGQLLAGWQRY